MRAPLWLRIVGTALAAAAALALAIHDPQSAHASAVTLVVLWWLWRR